MPKRINKTKEEIVQQIKNSQEVKRLRAFVKDQYYPTLCEASNSIDDAKFLVRSFSNMVMEQFLDQMKKTKFSDLNLESKLDKTAPKYDKYKEMLDLFKDENVYSAKELIEGMSAEIEMWVTNELKERPLSTLKTNFFE